tara:strand:- start:1049 stop:2044 length:996 start_codon:yes stop_codon:yes gene_type:complete
MARRHIVIGGAGFLGLELVKELAKSSQTIVVIDIFAGPELLTFFNAHNTSFFKRDISLPEALQDIDLGKDDIVHHLASKLIIPNKPRFNRFKHFAQSSVFGTKHVLDWMRAANCRNLIFWSSDMVYGLPSTTPISETMSPRPLGPYGRAKVIAEELIIQAEVENELRATIFRPRLIIGPGRLGILAKLFHLIKSGYPVPLIGSGDNIFQFVSVKDCAQASVIAAKKGCPSGIFNLSSDNSPSVKDLLSRLIEHAGSRSRLLPMPAVAVKPVLETLNLFKLAPMDQEQFRIADQNIVLSTLKAKENLGWHPKYNDGDMLVVAFEEYCRVTKN